MLPLLLVDCSGRAEALVVVALMATVVLVARAVVAQVAVAAERAAVHTQQALAALVGMVGHWCWSSEHEAICRG